MTVTAVTNVLPDADSASHGTRNAPELRTIVGRDH
jgi:hypothetical protein